MNPHPDAMILLASIRHRELQDEAARSRLAREAQGDDLPMRAAISMARHQLGAILVRVRLRLDGIGWVFALPRRGAFPR